MLLLQNIVTHLDQFGCVLVTFRQQYIIIKPEVTGQVCRLILHMLSKYDSEVFGIGRGQPCCIQRIYRRIIIM